MHGWRRIRPGGRLEPLALGEVRRDRTLLIIDDAGDRHVERRDLHDDVGLAERPLRRRLRRFGQRIRAGASGRARFDPVHDRLHLRVGQAQIVRPGRAVIVRVIRRHALRAQHFANHRCEALHDVVTVHRERPHAARRVAHDAFVREDRRNLARVVDLRELRSLAAIRKFDRRSLDRSLGDGRRAACEHGVERVGERRLLVPLARERAIDGAVVCNRPGPGVDHERFRRRGHAERAADELQLIGEHGQIGGPWPACELAAVSARRGVEHQKGDLLVLVRLTHLRQRRGGSG
jgi:hypothetical protein